MAVAVLVRRFGQLHEDPALIARWQSWLGPLLLLIPIGVVIALLSTSD